MREKAFGIFVALSILWHLLWMVSVSVVVMPVEFSLRGFPVVSFLGPILEDRFFKETAREDEPVDVLPLNGVEDIKVVVDLPEIINPDNILLEYQKEEIVSQGIDKIKEVPVQAKVELDKKLFESELVDLTGPARYREILSKPPLPEYPKWAEEMGMDFDIELKFSVSPLGEVKNTQVVVSSGYPEVDLLGTTYLKRWNFLPLQAGPRKEEWGVIKLHFRLKKE